MLRPSRVASYTSIPPNAILCPQLPASCPVMLQKREPKRVSRRRKFLADGLPQNSQAALLGKLRFL